MTALVAGREETERVRSGASDRKSGRIRDATTARANAWEERGREEAECVRNGAVAQARAGPGVTVSARQSHYRAAGVRSMIFLTSFRSGSTDVP